MAANVIYEPYVETFTNVSSVVATHSFGREVNVQVHVGSEPVFPEILFDSDDQLTVTFYENGIVSAKTGVIIVS